jgi:hypothetical protein
MKKHHRPQLNNNNDRSSRMRRIKKERRRITEKEMRTGRREWAAGSLPRIMEDVIGSQG